MRKQIIVLLTLMISLSSEAQNKDIRFTTGVFTGISQTGIAFQSLDKLARNVADDAQFDLQSSAPLSFEVGFRPTDKFAVGLLFSSQSFTGDIRGYTFNFKVDSVVIEDVNLNLKRRFIGITPKYIWKLKGEGRAEFYTAARIGYIFWSQEINTSDRSFELPEWLGLSRPAIGIVPIGGNVYVTDQFTVNFESAIAAPYVFRLGLQLEL